MTVQQHRAVPCAGNIEIEQGRAIGQPNDLHLEPAHALFLHPRFCEASDALDVTVGFPLRIEMRRLGRDANVFGELRNDIVVPLRGDGGKKGWRIHSKRLDWFSRLEWKSRGRPPQS